MERIIIGGENEPMHSPRSASSRLSTEVLKKFDGKSREVCVFPTRAPDLNCQYYQIIVQREGVLCHCQIPGLYRTPKSYDYLICCPLPTYFYIPIHNPGKLKMPVKTKDTEITVKKWRTDLRIHTFYTSYLIHQFIHIKQIN